MFRAISVSLRALGRAVPIVLRDLIGLTGAGLVAYGAWLIAPPAGFITGGVLLLAGAVLAGAAARERPPGA